MTREEANMLSWPSLGTCVVQLSFARNGAHILPDKRVTRDAICVLIRVGDVQEEDKQNYDFLIQIGKVNDHIPEGWIRAADEKCAFDLIQVFCKAHWFEQMMKANREEKDCERKATVVLCTYKRVETAQRALEAMSKQTMCKEDYEILVINNDPNSNEMRKLVLEAQHNSSTKEFIRYIDCPYQGLSSARNFALYEAKGKIVMFVDDDGLMEQHCLQRIVSAFELHKEAAVVGGQILLNKPERFCNVILPGYEGIWSEHRFNQKKYFETKNDSEYPYGCNYAIRRSTLRDLGGFRVSYGRMGKDFSGGEEMVLSHLVRKSGMSIGIEPDAVVIHDVDPSRYTLNHVKQTMRAGRLTNRQMKIDLYKDFDPWMKEEYYLLGVAQERFKQLQEAGVDKNDLKMIYCQYDLDATKEAIEAGQRDLTILREGISS